MSDTADDAQQVADLFTKLAGELDAFRNDHYDDLSPTQRADLEEQIQQLYDFHDYFVGAVIQNTLNAVQGDLTKLTNVARQAQQALQHLKTVAAVVNIASAASTLVMDIVVADYGAIPAAIRDLAQTIQNPSDKSSSSPPA